MHNICEKLYYKVKTRQMLNKLHNQYLAKSLDERLLLCHYGNFDHVCQTLKLKIN